MASSLPIEIRPDILKAIQSNLPVVALESTIITHGTYHYNKPHLF